MTFDQLITVIVLVAVVAALILDKVRADVVALTGAAVLLITGAVRPVEVQGAFASPAIIALASLFVIAYAMELSGLLDAAIEKVVASMQADRHGRPVGADRTCRRRLGVPQQYADRGPVGAGRFAMPRSRWAARPSAI